MQCSRSNWHAKECARGQGIGPGCQSLRFARWGPGGAFICRAVCFEDGAGLGRHPSVTPVGSVSVLSPAATLKSKQDELHRKALQTLER